MKIRRVGGGMAISLHTTELSRVTWSYAPTLLCGDWPLFFNHLGIDLVLVSCPSCVTWHVAGSIRLNYQHIFFNPSCVEDRVDFTKVSFFFYYFMYPTFFFICIAHELIHLEFVFDLNHEQYMCSSILNFCWSNK